VTRLEAFCKAFGWQGGTIHQVAAETGCKAEDLLAGKAAKTGWDSDHCGGWFAGRTCTVEFNRHTNFPPRKGNLDFWLGVADGLSAPDRPLALRQS
jgi:hypothetical protein